jgi:predicted metal-dependent phosphotriesterase family hydrolase
MSLVETVNGPVPVESLGLTLTHEHIVLLDSEVEVNQLGRWRDEVEIPAATESLRLAKASGGDALVDLTAIGQGRNVARVARIAAGTGVHVRDQQRLFREEGVDLPGLLDLGVTQDQVDQMLVGNPARLFSQRTPY